jgi:two-component system, NtrC family, nitrogen regulation sensor histidine kinase NtrY
MTFSFRTRLITVITVTIAVTVILVAWLVESNLRRSFELSNAARTNALVDQFSAGFQERGEQTAQRVDAIANSEPLLRIGLAAAQPQPDLAPFVNEAQTLAADHQLELLEVLAQDGTIISSAQWPARFGYKETWLADFDKGELPKKGFLKREELPEGEQLAIVAIRQLKVRSAVIYIVGGQKLDEKYFQSFQAPLGLRPMLYRYTGNGFSPANFISFSVPVNPSIVKKSAPPELRSPEKIAPLIDEVQKQHAASLGTKLTRNIEWNENPEDAETVHTDALVGNNNELLGVLLVATPVREQIRLARHVRNVAFSVGLGGILFGVLLSSWLAGRITRPIEQLAAAATQVAGGDWNAHVAVSSTNEIGQLAEAFNRMTHELIAQREQLVQTERVAAWRELARRLAHELKNPLFPLQITVENLLRAREIGPDQFDEVFRESTSTLLAELSNLKNIVGRFSDFSKMPTPQLQEVNVNALLRDVAQLYQAQISRNAGLKVGWALADDLPTISADPVLLRRAIENLVLNAMDVMPQGGTLTFRTAMNREEQRAIIEVADTGAGLTPEECERLFTPYYTTKQFGTGLGLAIVQSVVADHGGTISVTSAKSAGTTFHIELPVRAKDAVT